MPQYLGPYEILAVNSADIQCKHLVTGAIGVYHMDKLKPCFSTREEAYKAAMVDFNQFEVDKILSFKGDPEMRSSMEFKVQFADGSVSSLPYSKDLSDTVQFEKYVREQKCLLPLLYTKIVWERIKKESYQRVVGVSIGDICYVDLRAWGSGYFENLQLPVHDTKYVVLCRYIRWEGRNQRRIILECPLFGVDEFAWDSFTVYAYGTEMSILPGMVLVDKAFCRVYPQILE
jgi:hypothetical protein